MNIIRFNQEDMDNLAKQDAQMARAIDLIGKIERKGYDDIFTAIVENIISQQLSVKAAGKIIERLRNVIGDITPQNIISQTNEELRGAGLSERKVRYIIGVAKAQRDGVIDCDALACLDDNEVVEKLIQLDGIGEWTAQMLLIFALGRQNVLPHKDLGIKKGLSLFYGPDYNYQEIYRRLSPYNTMASFYIWEINARGGLD